MPRHDDTQPDGALFELVRGIREDLSVHRAETRADFGLVRADIGKIRERQASFRGGVALMVFLATLVVGASAAIVAVVVR